MGTYRRRRPINGNGFDSIVPKCREPGPQPCRAAGPLSVSPPLTARPASTNQRDINPATPSPKRLHGSATVRLAITAGRGAKLRFISIVDNLGVQEVLVPELSDGAVLLRPLSSSDAQDHLAGEDEELVRGLNGGSGTLDTVARHIATAQDMWLAGGPTFSFAIRSAMDDRLAGTIDVQLKPDQTPQGFANLAFGLYPPYRGRGWAVRAVELAVRFLRRRDDTTHVLIRVEPANSASIAVAHCAGFSVYAEPPDTPDAYIWYRRSLSEGGPRRRHQPIAEMQERRRRRGKTEVTRHAFGSPGQSTPGPRTDADPDGALGAGEPAGGPMRRSSSSILEATMTYPTQA